MNLIEQMITIGMEQLNITVGGSSKLILPSLNEIPDYSAFIEAARDLKAKDPRVVVVLTGMSTLMACAFYDVGLHGKKFVFFWEGVFMFQSNDPLKPPHCTEHKLASVLRSVIFVSQAMPSNMDPDHVDAIGMTPRKFDSMLKTALKDDNPQTMKSWFQWRAVFYCQIVGISLVLDKVERKLQSFDRNITEWMTNGDNFQRNGSFIRNLLHKEFRNFKYKGLNTYGTQFITEPVMEAGFHQMQQNDSELTSAVSFKAVPVAFFFGKTGQLEMRQPLKWRTKNNRIPADSVSYITKQVPFLPNATKYPMFSLSLAFIFIVVGIWASQLKRTNQSDNSRNHSFKYTTGIAIGNLGLAIFIAILAIFKIPTPVTCSVASVIVIFSQWITNLSILAKLETARTIFSNDRAEKTLKKLTTAATARYPRPPQTSIQNESTLPKKLENYWKIIISIACLFALLATIWFIADPLTTTRVFIRLETNDEEDAYVEEISKVCIPSGSSFTIFVVVFAGTFVILFIRIIQLGFLTKHINDKSVAEIVPLRVTAFVSISITIFGIATIILLFASNPVPLLTSTLTLAIILLFINVSFQLYSCLWC